MKGNRSSIDVEMNPVTDRKVVITLTSENPIKLFPLLRSLMVFIRAQLNEHGVGWDAVTPGAHDQGIVDPRDVQ